jgi:hypothetical protein
MVRIHKRKRLMYRPFVSLLQQLAPPMPSIASLCGSATTQRLESSREIRAANGSGINNDGGIDATFNFGYCGARLEFGRRVRFGLGAIDV